jgi:hypothetical protein
MLKVQHYQQIGNVGQASALMMEAPVSLNCRQEQ